MKSIQERITEFGIGATIRNAPHNPHMRPRPDASRAEIEWERDASHWRLYLRNASNGERMQTYFSMGSGHEGRQPTVAEVLSSLLLDASTVENTANYRDFADEMGMEPDTHTQRMYDTIVEQTAKLATFLGDLALWLDETDNDV